jgi:beta-glucanase (GH16 family)
MRAVTVALKLNATSAILCLLMSTGAAASVAPPASGMLFDPTSAAQIAGLHLVSCSAAAATSGSSAAIRADFTPTSDYPNVEFPVPDGGWDLSTYGGVEVQVTNVGASDVNASLRVDNAGDWHLNPWATHSVDLPPGQTKTIKVIFAVSQYPLDPAHIVGMQVYLAKPSQPASLLIAGLRAYGLPESRPITATFSTEAGRNVPVQPPSWIGKRPPVPGDWVETLDENFNAASLNPKLWGERAPGWNGLMDGHLERYSPQNVILQDGFLKIKCERKTGHEYDDPTLPSRDYTSGQLMTWGHWTQTYGYFEARMKLPTTRGLWPAFWMMPDRGSQSPDPYTTYKSGMEFDILEQLSEWGPGRYNVAVHWDGYADDHQSWGSEKTYYGSTADDWHTWGLLWEPAKAVWYCDGVKKAEFDSPRVSSVPEYIILMVQIGGWATDKVDDAHLPDYLRVKYVRAWQLKSRLAPVH